MVNEPIPSSGAMERGGAYNQHAKIPASGSAFALTHWERAVGAIPLDLDDQPVVIADYGASQGKNSLAPMRVAIEALRGRLKPERPILIYHEDLPANDFNALFELLDSDQDSYALHDPYVFPCAIGRSFYKSVLPSNYVHLGWSNYAAMWISRIPTQIPGHFFVPRSTGDIRAAFERQGAQDWENFLSLRAGELRPGGRLVVSVPGADEQGMSGHENIMDQANATLAEMVEEGAITADERARMVIGVWPRQRSDLLAPFAGRGRFKGLKVEHCETNALTDSAWDEYQMSGNTEALAEKHALYFRAIFAPTLAGALHSNDIGHRGAFCDQLGEGLKRRLMNRPEPIKSLVETIVVAKG
jgi:SAM dependent carboxyl methyltransferase